MSCEVLVINIAKDPFLRGEPVVVKDQPCDWGTREGLPNYCILTISDASAAQVMHYLDPIALVFTYDVLASNENGYRLEVSINPAIVTEFGADKAMRTEMYTWLQENYSAVYVPLSSNPPYSYVIDIPDPNLDLQELKQKFEEQFIQQLDPHRYYFPESDMDYAVSQGGYITLTAAQAASHIIDRLGV